MSTKEVTKDFCAKLDAAIDAVQLDGVGMDDADEILQAGFALKGLIMEFKADKAGTALMLISDLSEMIYDERAEV